MKHVLLTYKTLRECRSASSGLLSDRLPIIKSSSNEKYLLTNFPRIKRAQQKIKLNNLRVIKINKEVFKTKK